MSLYATKNDCITLARTLPRRYEDYNITELADAYCKAVDEKDEKNKSVYLCALLLRFWYTIDKMYNSVKSFGYEREDVFERLYDCIEAACYYRAWQDPEKHTNAQACINQVISSRGVPAMVGEAQFQKNTRASLSLDDPISGEGESTFGDTLVDETATAYDSARMIIQSMLFNNKIVEAIIADKIAYNDVFKHFKKAKKKSVDDQEYKYVEHSSEFWPFKVVQELNQIDEAYVKYFIKNYTVDANIFANAITMLSKANNQKKYRLISKSLETMKAFV